MITMTDIRTKVQDCIDHAVSLYGDCAQFTPSIDVCRGKSMGKCKVRAAAVRSNSHVTLYFNIDAMNMGLEALNNTVPHEVAHALTFLLYGTMKHDRNWRVICIALGGNGERCHAEKLPAARQTRKFQYTATCGSRIDLSLQMHRKVQGGAVRVLKATRGRILASGYVSQAA